MRILIAEDDRVSRRVLTTMLEQWGYEVQATTSGEEAWNVLQLPGAPELAVLDWMMPGLDGVEICRRVRVAPETEGAYLMMLTTRGAKADIIAALDAGADDYITKPFVREELRARIQAGVRVLTLRHALTEHIERLQRAMAEIRQLRRLLPICSVCKKVRDDENYWHTVESYFARHTDVRFSHGVCPSCYERHYEPLLRDKSDRPIGGSGREREGMA